MAQPGDSVPSPAVPVAAGRRPRRPLAYAAIIVAGLLAGFALGWGGGVFLGGDRAAAEEHRYVQGTCRALANFHADGMTWADEQRRREATLAHHNLWVAVTGYAQAAIEVDSTFDFARHNSVEGIVKELRLVDYEGMAQTEAALEQLCADREL